MAFWNKEGKDGEVNQEQVLGVQPRFDELKELLTVLAQGMTCIVLVSIGRNGRIGKVLEALNAARHCAVHKHDCLIVLHHRACRKIPV